MVRTNARNGNFSIVFVFGQSRPMAQLERMTACGFPGRPFPFLSLYASILLRSPRLLTSVNVTAVHVGVSWPACAYTSTRGLKNPGTRVHGKGKGQGQGERVADNGVESAYVAHAFAVSSGNRTPSDGRGADARHHPSRSLLSTIRTRRTELTGIPSTEEFPFRRFP